MAALTRQVIEDLWAEYRDEFTAMEIYVAYKDYYWMMEMVEQCLEHIARAINDPNSELK